MYRNATQTPAAQANPKTSGNRGVSWNRTLAHACVERKQVRVYHEQRLGYGCGMPKTVDPVIAQNRLAYLEHLRVKMFEGNAAALARSVNTDGNQVRQYLDGGRNIGERFARHVEKELGLDLGVMDRPVDELEHQDEEDLKPDEAALLRKYRNASPDGRVAIQNFAGLSTDDRSKMSEELLKLIFCDPVEDNRMGKEWRNPDGAAANDPSDANDASAKGKKRKGR